MKSKEDLDEAGSSLRLLASNFIEAHLLCCPKMWYWGGVPPSRDLTRVSGHFAKAGTSCRTEQILCKCLKHSHVAASTVSHPLAHQTAYALAILACLGLLLQIVPSRKGLACMFMECLSFLDGERMPIQLHPPASA